MGNHFSRRKFLKHSRTAILGFSALAFSGLSCNSRVMPAEGAIASLENQIPQLMNAAGVAGAAIALVRDGQILWNRGFGVENAATGKPVSENTVFAAASLSKPLFAYAAIKLAEKGELNLDIPLTEYTDKPYISDPRIKQITARMVLSHTCGFPNWSGDDPVWIEFAPGSRFSYSSEGYLYLQSVVERLTGQRLNDYMRRHVFAPLGMTSSSYVWMPQYEASAAKGHDRSGNPEAGSKPKQANAAGSLRTTAADYAKFLSAMMEPGSTESDRLTEASLTQMLRQQVGINKSLGWGMGWGLERASEGDFFWHWGDSIIFKSFALASRNLRTGIVILTNSENGLRIGEDIVRLTIGGQHPAFDFDMIDY